MNGAGMRPARALIVDDEKPARERLRRLLTRDNRVELAGSCAGGAEALDVLRAAAQSGAPVQLMFLDVQMPELDGFGVLSDAGARQAAGADAGGRLRDGVRRIRAAGVRSARDRLPAQAVQRREVSGHAGSRLAPRPRRTCGGGDVAAAGAPRQLGNAGRAARGPRRSRHDGPSIGWSCGDRIACGCCRSSRSAGSRPTACM